LISKTYNINFAYNDFLITMPIKTPILHRINMCMQKWQSSA